MSRFMHIEALTMVNMAQKEILPAVSQYSYDLATNLCNENRSCQVRKCL